MGKLTRLSMFVPGDTPPDLGFGIDWSDTYLDAIQSTALFSGYFKANVSGGLSNIIVFSDQYERIPNPDYVDPPVDPDDMEGPPEFLFISIEFPVLELDISDTASFSTVYGGDLNEIRVSNNPLLEEIISDNLLTTVQANSTALKKLPENIANGATIRVDNSGFTQQQVDDLFQPIASGGVTDIIIENNGNADIDPLIVSDIETNGGTVWETNSGIMKFQTTSAVTTAFTFFINAGADVDWYLDGVEHTANSNNAIFFFTDATVKTIEVRGADVSQGQWMSMTGKSLTGTCDISAMISASARVDFSNNPDLSRVILPKSDGIMDQLMGYSSGISELRLDKLPGLVNSANIQIRLGNCPNLDTDSVALSILSIDTNLVNGRQFWVNGTTPVLDPAIKTLLQTNNWTVIE